MAVVQPHGASKLLAGVPAPLVQRMDGPFVNAVPESFVTLGHLGTSSPPAEIAVRPARHDEVRLDTGRGRICGRVPSVPCDSWKASAYFAQAELDRRPK